MRISDTLKLPNESVTQTFAILAKRGVGKTYTSSVIVEEMLKAGLKVVIVDPIGVWWGLRTSANGKEEGLQIIIAGGDRADVPIEPGSGEVIANFVVDNDLPLLIDLSHFRKNQQTQFMTDFAEHLYHRNRSAMHLVLDEADAFAPQRPYKGQERMLGATEDLVRRGRARGIGVTLITQRPAVLNKDVLTQVEVLITLRLIAPQDRAAIDEWIKVHGTPEQRIELMESLPSLPVGTAWFWSPGWLDIFQRVKIRTRETFDSSKTPKVGQKIITPKSVANVDLGEIKKKLAATIEKTKADDPKELRKQIIQLQRELQKKPQESQVKVERVEVPILNPKDIQTLHKVATEVVSIGQSILKAINIQESKPRYQAKPNPTPLPTRIYNSPKMETLDDVKITGGAQRILNTLGSRYPMTFTRSQLATLSKLSPRSGTYGTYLSLLRSKGLIKQEGDKISLTDLGVAEIGEIATIPQTTDEVINMWRNNLTGGARRMFDVLVGYYPAEISRAELGDETEMSSNSGTFGTYLSMLRGNGLIDVTGGGIKASDNLFV